MNIFMEKIETLTLFIALVGVAAKGLVDLTSPV